MDPRILAALAPALLGACLLGKEPGYSASNPTEITCGCHDGQTCYDGAAQLAKERGETAETGEQLLYFAQCACFQESFAGCNTLAHYAKDYVAQCEHDVEVAKTCTIAAFVHEHGVAVPRMAGRSFKRDAAAAKAAFARACAAGSKVACAHARP